MRIDEIMVEVEQYLKIDETNLARESLETPKVYGKVLRLRTHESLMLKRLKYDFKRLYQKKREYYLGKADPSVYKEKPFDFKVLKSEVDNYIEADSEVEELTVKIEMQDEKIYYLDAALKQISNRGFAIKSAIDFQKMMNGGY